MRLIRLGALWQERPAVLLDGKRAFDVSADSDPLRRPIDCGTISTRRLSRLLGPVPPSLWMNALHQSNRDPSSSGSPKIAATCS